MSYGVANQKIDLNSIDVNAILKYASTRQVDAVDTAPSYGESEKLIGNFHTSNKKFLTHTKIPAAINLTPESVIHSINLSLARLQVTKLDILYFHSADFLISENKTKVRSILNSITQTGLVGKIGVSVYSEEEVYKILNEWNEIEVYQVPENILDQRLINSNLISSAANTGKNFHVRSIFLQGLLLMNFQEIPKHLQVLIPQLQNLQKSAKRFGMSQLEFILSYLSMIEWASGFLVGATSVVQLEEILNAPISTIPFQNLPKPLQGPLVDPRNW
jgi:aryl-alcohol dehydrogenase-like predicted oxidoreductase